MGQPPGAGDLPSLRLVARAATADGRIAFALGPPPRWQRIPSYTLVPLELPGSAPPAGVPDGEAACQALGELGLAAEIVASPWTHAPSPAHAIDRHRWAGADPAPFLELARTQPVEQGAGVTLRRVAVRVYRARLAASAPGHADPITARRLLWLAQEQLRALVRGLPLADLRVLIARDPSDPAALDWLPDDALIYLPADYGERYLLRVLAKYGNQALFG
jgi:hypothetical protein